MAAAAVVQALIKIGSAFGDAALQPLEDLMKKEVALLIELPELAKFIGRELDTINSFLVQVQAKIHSTGAPYLRHPYRRRGFLKPCSTWVYCAPTDGGW
ncbi:hypothetical protein ABZP36_031631 [Zizania latifolia]